jgi:hypothetical protein
MEGIVVIPLGARWGALGVAALAVLAALGCSNEPLLRTEPLGRLAGNLSATTLRVFGVEQLNDWTAVFSTPTLTLSSTRVQGSWSLSVPGGGWSSFRSRAIAKEDPSPTARR